MSDSTPDGRQAALAAIYLPKARAALAESIVPFWARTLDHERGGVFNCWDNRGERLLSRDKFTWSQGRFAWLWSRLGTLVTAGQLPGDAAGFWAHAAKTVGFLQSHAFLADGRCAFLLSEDGVVKEALPGKGAAPSIYADGFVVLGLAEFARVSSDRDVLMAAWRLFENIEHRIAAGGFPTHPEPIPDGFDAHAIAMILLNLTVVLNEACEGLGDSRTSVAREKMQSAAAAIFERFLLPGGRLVEMRPLMEGQGATLLARHANPGHALEGLWMLLTVAKRLDRVDWVARASEAVHYALRRGWDEEYGGLFHYIDVDGGAPRGEAGASIYEANVRATWATKLWWVHSEAIYTTALCYRLTQDEAIADWFRRIWEYAFSTFPHPDPVIGEWIQIRDRRGAPLERVVALPVKDPYHIARNLIQVIELFSEPLSPPFP